MAMPKDLNQFLSDPAFKDEADLVRGTVKVTIEEELKAARERAEKGSKETGLFDFLFSKVKSDDKGGFLGLGN